jgi:DNA gyrase/topoisomerase IV subunit B
MTHYAQRFAKGIAETALENRERATRSGTRVSLLPDPEIFRNTWFETGPVAARLR